VFEYLEGCLLVEEIQRLGRMPARRALVIARQIAAALEAAHGAGIAHLDLKSDNVFLTDRPDAIDHAVLFDFGISRFMAATAKRASQRADGNAGVHGSEQVASPDLADCARISMRSA